MSSSSFFLVDYLPLARELRDAASASRSGAPTRITSRLDAFVDSSKSEALRGDAVLARLYAALDSCGLERTSTQRFFHKKFVESILPWIYGKKDFSRFKERVLHEAGIHPDKYNQYTLISTPRRWGKTTSVGIFVAATLYAVPDAWISVYSTGRRASKALSDLVHKFLKRLEEGAGLKRSNVLVKNTEELFYAGDVGSDVRRLFSYPASVQVRRVFSDPPPFVRPLPSPSSRPRPLVSRLSSFVIRLSCTEKQRDVSRCLAMLYK
ncbi:MAG: hypothetical protein CMI16_07000 [Opitutaceae bacterium]|nr:hypothetical protein [Opitutaceae bacterium]